MPFDAAGFPPEPPPRTPKKPRETLIATLAMLVCLFLMLAPISLGAWVDLYRYLRGH